MDWDDAYSNAAHIPGGVGYLTKWPQLAAEFRCNLPIATSMTAAVSYGAHHRQVYDLFMPDTGCRGLWVFVHGGYWMQFSKDDWSHLAGGALAHKWAVMMPSYRLCPEVRVNDIALDAAAAIGHAADRILGPIRLAGHSAGGHLVTRLVCEGSALPASVLARINGVVSISGLHDLQPLLKTSMNATLQISAEDARRESPALLPPLTKARITCWVGGQERPEFIRQTDLMVTAWGERGASIVGHHESGRHHFNVVEDLCDAGSALCRVAAG